MTITPKDAYKSRKVRRWPRRVLDRIAWRVAHDCPNPTALVRWHLDIERRADGMRLLLVAEWPTGCAVARLPGPSWLPAEDLERGGGA
jgi:hypothetical protein